MTRRRARATCHPLGLADDQQAVLILVAGRPDNSNSRIDVVSAQRKATGDIPEGFRPAESFQRYFAVNLPGDDNSPG
jgi:hypothetical protein